LGEHDVQRLDVNDHGSEVLKRRNSWTPELEAARIPSYLAIANALISDIRSGRLAPGDPLPSQRNLAKELDLSLTTITRAFQEVHRRGFIVSERGRGTFIRKAKPSPGSNAIRSHQASKVELTRNFRIERLIANGSSGSKRPVGSSLTSRWSDALEAASSWLCPLLPTIEQDRIVVFQNEGDALITVLSTVIGLDRALLVEPLIAPALAAVFRLLGITLLPVEIDDEGIVPDALLSMASLHNCRVLYCSPTFQNPTNTKMSFSRRRAIVAAARDHGITIIENGGYDRLDADTIPLAGLEPELCFYIANLSAGSFGAIKATYTVARTQSEAQRLLRLQTEFLMDFDPHGQLSATRAILDGTADAILKEIIRDIGSRSQAVRSTFDGNLLKTHPNSPFGWLSLDKQFSAETIDSLNGKTSFLLPDECFQVKTAKQIGGLRVSFGCFDTLRGLTAALLELRSAIQSLSPTLL
jgi:DNA-binding transcriptional MocR family regulator